MRIDLPLPPSVNHYWGQSGVCKYLSKDARDFRLLVQLACKFQHVPNYGDARLSIIVIIHAKNYNRQDLDNRIKPLFDALTHAGVYDDDSQIDCFMVKRGEVMRDGKCVVYINKMGDNEDAISQITF